MMQHVVTMLALPLALANPPAPANTIKYQHGDKCLSVGAAEQGRDPSWGLVLSDCGNAATWAEGFSSKHGPWPQISAAVSHSTVRSACLSIANGTGLCPAGLKVHAAQCEDDTKSERPSDRFSWDDSAKKIRSNLCMGLCVDVDGDSIVLNNCSNVNGWTRQGPPVPPPFVPQTLEPAAPTGRYHMFWPLPEVAGLPVVGISQDGYPDYYGVNNAEICPPGRRYDCAGVCKCHWPNVSDVPLWHGGKINGKTPGTVAHAIKRSEILQRAIIWVAHGFASDGDKGRGIAQGIEGCSQGDSRKTCPEYFHGGACCSLPTMAWNVSSGNCLRNGHQSIRVDCKSEMKPGDAVSLQKHGTDTGHNFPGAEHIVLFRRWINKAKTHMMVYERKGKARLSQYALGPHMYCMKRQNIIEDVETETVAPFIV